MTAASPRSFEFLHLCVEPAFATAQKSRAKVSPQSSVQTPREMAAGVAHGRARALAARRAGIGGADFRDWFAPAFARWLQINFRDAETVAVTFGVRYQTALNWWNAAHRASGDTVALVFVAFPNAVAWFLAEWEGGR